MVEAAGKFKIAVWTHRLGQGGAERVLGQLAASFASFGHDIDVYVHTDDNPYARGLDLEANLHLISTPWARLARPRILAYAFAMSRVLRATRPDVLLTSGYVMNAGAVIARYLSGTGTRVFIREANTFWAQANQASSRREALMWRLARQFYPAAHGMIAPSSGVTEDLWRSFPSCRDKIHTIANPIDIVDVQQRATEPLPEAMEGHVRYILGVGRLVPQKDFATLIRAWAKVRARHDVDLVILGEGPLEADLRTLAASLGLGDRLYLPGFDPNPFRFMQKCVCYALSSRFEGLPNTLLQAMAVGAPVVATDCPSGPREILHDGKLGPLVPIGDVDQMATQIEEMLLGHFDPIMGMEEVRTRYTAQTIAAEYIGLFVSGRSRPPTA